MKSIKAWLLRWKMKRVIAALAYRTDTSSANKKRNSGILEFGKMLEATELMTRGTKGADEISMSCTRDELTSFIGYMTRLHDSRLSVFIRARIGLATLFMSTQEVLGEDPKEFYERERAAAQQAGGKRETGLIGPDGKDIKVKI